MVLLLEIAELLVLGERVVKVVGGLAAAEAVEALKFCFTDTAPIPYLLLLGRFTRIDIC